MNEFVAFFNATFVDRAESGTERLAILAPERIGGDENCLVPAIICDVVKLTNEASAYVLFIKSFPVLGTPEQLGTLAPKLIVCVPVAVIPPVVVKFAENVLAPVMV